MSGGLKGWAGRLLHRSGSDVTDDTASRLAPAQTFCAIGDIHGCNDLLRPLYQTLRSDCGPDVPVVFLGDMVDRGPDSRPVLTFIHDLCRTLPEAHIALMGNHEAMMIDFLDAPEASGVRWIHYGGRETLISFGIDVPPGHSDPAVLGDLRDQLIEAMSPDLLNWLRTLPSRWSTGNVHCVHAAMAPDRPVDRQTSQVLTHGHRDFLRRARTDGQIVVHGHTIMPDPICAETRISLDTGAYATGRLTGAVIKAGECRFVT